LRDASGSCCMSRPMRLERCLWLMLHVEANEA
jgi:hypothetical protein